MKLADYPRATLILRNVPKHVCDTVVEVVRAESLSVGIEITRNSSNFEDIARYAAGGGIAIGAGTVLSLADAKAAVDQGCQFVLAPVVMPQEIIDFCHASDVLVVSGAYSPTEIWEAARRGSDIVKVFPVRDLGASYLQDVKAPLGDVPLMAVGGVTLENAAGWLSRGASYVGIGTGLFPKPAAELRRDDIERSLRSLAAL